MRFEKWQALGNDYVIVERAALPFALTPARIRRLCDRHTGIGADGILQLEPPGEPGFVARLRIFNPDGSEAELSGNGAREAILYLRRAGWTQADQFSIQTVAGEIRPTITSPTTCTVDMGARRSASPATSAACATCTCASATRRPRSASRPGALEQLDLAARRPGHRERPAVPGPHERVLLHRARSGPHPRAIFERGWGRRELGHGACGAAIAHVLRGGDSPVTVVLTVASSRSTWTRASTSTSRAGRSRLRAELDAASSPSSPR
jgi:diaminopimelate epimerase